MHDKLTGAWQWLKHEKRAVWLEYGLLSLAVLLPLLLPGYVLTLDMVFTPHATWPQELTNTYPLEALIWLLHVVLPGDMVEKLVLFIILLLSGVGMHVLLRSVNVKDRFAPDLWRMALYFGGAFYMINPFTYSRFMAGQWLFLLGYAMLPFFVKALVRFFSFPGKRTLVPLVAWTFAIVSASVHHVGIVLLLAVAVPALASALGYWRGKKHIARYAAWSGAAVAALLALCSYWLIAAALGNGAIGSAVARMNAADFGAFATSGNGALGALGNVIRLQGFWPEARQLYALPQSMVPMWGLLFLVVWIVVITGLVKAWRSHRLLVALAAFCIVTGILLAATPLVEWASRVLPFISGYREPHKFASLIAFGYAMLGTFGVAFTIRWASERFNETAGQIATVACLLLPLAVTPTMLWGFAGQLTPRHFPAGWHEMNAQLKETAGAANTLFLPWHQYMSFGFSGRIIANPAEKFFETPVIASDDPEFKGVAPTVPDSEKAAIKKALDTPETLPHVLRSRNIRYIMLAKEDGADAYAYLGALSGIAKTAENGSLILYEVEK